MIGPPGGLAAETPGVQVEGGVRRCGTGAEEEAVWELRCTGTAQEPTLEGTAAAQYPGKQAQLPVPQSLLPVSWRDS